MVDKDRYGRTVGKVVLPDGAVLNHALVEAGLAWHYVQYAPDDKTLAALEKAAREAHVGLWGDPTPIPPLGMEGRASGPRASRLGTVQGNSGSIPPATPGTTPGADITATQNRVARAVQPRARRAGCAVVDLVAMAKTSLPSKQNGTYAAFESREPWIPLRASVAPVPRPTSRIGT